VHIRDDQTIAFHGHPLTSVGGAVICDPPQLPIAVTAGTPLGARWRCKPSAKRNTSSCFAGGRRRTLSGMAFFKLMVLCFDDIGADTRLPARVWTPSAAIQYPDPARLAVLALDHTQYRLHRRDVGAVAVETYHN